MIESKEYKNHKNDIKEKTFDDFMYSDGFTDGYENGYKTALEWQKPEDVELVDGDVYLVKLNESIYYLRYLPSTYDGFYGLDYNGLQYTGQAIQINTDTENLLIKQIEVQK